MTIASEITRLQWAKATARTSIINKWVDVPVSASVEDYHTYIDQINTGGVFMDSLKLAGYVVSWIDDSPYRAWFISWDDSNAYYWAVVIKVDYGNYRYLYLVCAKKTSWSDMAYYKNTGITVNKNNYWLPEWTQFYKKDWAIRAFFCLNYSSASSNPWYWYKADWNLMNNQVTMEYIGRSSSKNTLPQEADTTWYTQTTENSWIKSISWDSISDDAYIFITTK